MASEQLPALKTQDSRLKTQIRQAESACLGNHCKDTDAYSDRSLFFNKGLKLRSLIRVFRFRRGEKSSFEGEINVGSSGCRADCSCGRSTDRGLMTKQRQDAGTNC